MSLEPKLPFIIDQLTTSKMALDSFQTPSHGNVGWHTLISNPLTPTDSMCAGIATCPPGGFLALHQHKQAEIYYILSGSGDVEIEGVRHRVAENNVLWIPGDAVHGVFCNPGESLKWFYVFAEGQFGDIVYRFRDAEASAQSYQI